MVWANVPCTDALPRLDSARPYLRRIARKRTRMNIKTILTHPVRRALALLIPLAFLSAFVLRVVDGSVVGITENLLTAFGFLGLLALLFWFGPRFSEKLIDERDRDFRNKVFYKTAMAMGIALLGLYMLATLLLLWSGFETGIRNVVLILAEDVDLLLKNLFQTVMLIVMAPFLVMAWLEPDPIPDDSVTQAYS